MKQIRVIEVVEVISDPVPGCDVSEELFEARNTKYNDRKDLVAVFSSGRTEREAVLNAVPTLVFLQEEANVETRFAKGLFNAIGKEAEKRSFEVKPLAEEHDAVFALTFFKFEEVA